MERKKRQEKKQGKKGRKADRNPDLIQEYDFFVTRVGGETPYDTPMNRSPQGKKMRAERNKSRIFFLSD